MRSPALPLVTLGALAALAGGVGSALLPPGATAPPLLLAAGTGLLLAGLFLLGTGASWGRRMAALAAAPGIGGGLGLLVLLDARAAATPAGEALLLGLPPGAALVVYGLGLLPVIVFPLLFALTETGSGPAGGAGGADSEGSGP